MQRRMVSSALALHRGPDEDFSLFKRRVDRECAKHIATTWSSLWCSSSISWRDHLHRDWKRQQLHYDDGIHISKLGTNFSWASVILSTWGSDWLNAHRVYSNNHRNLKTRISALPQGMQRACQHAVGRGSRSGRGFACLIHS